jgi:hypothetical protein
MRGLFIVAILVIGRLQAQTFQTTDWLKVNREVDRQLIFGIDEQVAHICQTLDSRGHWRVMEVPLDSGAVVLETDIELSNGAKLEEAMTIRESSYLFYSFFDRDEKRFGILQLGKVRGAMEWTRDTLWTTKWARTDIRPEISVAFSPDSTHYLIAQTMPAPRRKDDPVVLTYHTLHGDILWEKELILPASTEAAEVLSVHVSNVGLAYLLTGVNVEKVKSSSSKFRESHSVLFCYNSNTNKLKEYDVSFKDKHVLSTALLMDDRGVVRVFGYYSEIQEHYVRGTFLFVISPDGGPFIRATYMPMDPAFMAQVIRSEGRSAESISDLYLDHYFWLPNDEIALVGERFHAAEYASIDPITNSVRVTHYFHYDDIVIHVMDSLGRLVRQNWIPKRQTTIGTDRRWCSYLLMKCGDTFRFYYNDMKSNAGIAQHKSGELAEWTGQRQDDVHLYEMGVQERDVFLDHPSGRKELLQPQPTAPFDACRGALYFQDGREFCLLVPKF